MAHASSTQEIAANGRHTAPALRQRCRAWVGLAGAAALVALGATPAFADSGYYTTCDQSNIKWTPVQQVTLYPETTNNGVPAPDTIWSGTVHVTVDCQPPNQPELPLSGASFIVAGYSSSLSDLHVTVDGSDPSQSGNAPTALPVASINPITHFPTNQPLVLATDLVSGQDGSISFDMRAFSPSHDDLSANGAPTPIGLQFEVGTATPTDAGSDPVELLGGGQIFAATPELDSIVLFGSGAVSLAGYGLLRMRGRRRG